MNNKLVNRMKITRTENLTIEKVKELYKSIGYSDYLPAINKKFILTWPDALRGCSILNLDGINYRVEYYDLK